MRKLIRRLEAVNPIVWVAYVLLALVAAGVAISTQTHIVQSVVSMVVGAFS